MLEMTNFNNTLLHSLHKTTLLLIIVLKNRGPLKKQNPVSHFDFLPDEKNRLRKQNHKQ